MYTCTISAGLLLIFKEALKLKVIMMFAELLLNMNLTPQKETDTL